MAPPSKNGDSKRAQVLDDMVNSDLTAIRNEYHFRTPFLADRLAPLLKDQRDLPMLLLQLNIVEAVVPGVLLVYGVNMWQPAWPLLVRNLIGLVYVLAIVILFFERFILMLHFSSHLKMYHNETLNAIPVWVFSPFFGIPCGLYKLHHVVMHHIENNHEFDTSSTERYQRDSWSDFFWYWVHFVCLIWIELPKYCLSTKRYEWLRSIMYGLIIWVSCIALLAKLVNPLATLWVFVIPHIVAMSVMSFGNWSQHVFVNPENSKSNYALTYNCIDSPGNQTTFNDGYHVLHHLNARLHWSELATTFHEKREAHLENDAITFRGVHFFDVGVLVMTKQLKKLATHYVYLGPKEKAPTLEEVEVKLRSWLKPVPADQNEKKAK